MARKRKASPSAARKRKSKGKVVPTAGPAPSVAGVAVDDPAPAFAIGDKVKVIAGDYASTRGPVEAIGAKGVTVRVHARLAVTVPAEQVQAV